MSVFSSALSFINKHLLDAYCVPGTMSDAADSWLNQNDYKSEEEGAYRLAGMTNFNQSCVWMCSDGLRSGKEQDTLKREQEASL